MNEINYQAWSLYENFGVYTAAALWCGKNPYYPNQWSEMEYIEVRNLVLHILKYQLDAENYPLYKRNAVIMILAERFDKGINEFLKECKPFVLSRNQLKAIAEQTGARPRFLFESDSYLSDYSIVKPEPELETNKDMSLNDVPDSVSSAFSNFKGLRANEISLVVMENKTLRMIIRKKAITVHPDELGLKTDSQMWKLFEGAAVNHGCLQSELRKLNSSSNLGTEKGKIKAAVSRLRKSLKNAIGLMDDPIIYMKDNGYIFTFKVMTHELLNDGNISKGADAMNYINGEAFDDNRHGRNSFLDEDE